MKFLHWTEIVYCEKKNRKINCYLRPPPLISCSNRRVFLHRAVLSPGCWYGWYCLDPDHTWHLPLSKHSYLVPSQIVLEAMSNIPGKAKKPPKPRTWKDPLPQVQVHCPSTEHHHPSETSRSCHNQPCGSDLQAKVCKENHQQDWKQEEQQQDKLLCLQWEQGTHRPSLFGYQSQGLSQAVCPSIGRQHCWESQSHRCFIHWKHPWQWISSSLKPIWHRNPYSCWWGQLGTFLKVCPSLWTDEMWGVYSQGKLNCVGWVKEKVIKCAETSFYRQAAHQGKLADLRGHENISEVSPLVEEKTWTWADLQLMQEEPWQFVLAQEHSPDPPQVAAVLLPPWSWIISVTAALSQGWSLPWPRDGSCAGSAPSPGSAQERAHEPHLKEPFHPDNISCLKQSFSPQHCHLPSMGMLFIKRK